MRTARLLCGEAIEKLRSLPDKCVDCVVTSPPYWSVRNYRVTGQVGLEKTPELYRDRMVAIFHEVWRVLKPGRTLWLNLGDTWATGAGSGNKMGGTGTISHYRALIEQQAYPAAPPNRFRIQGYKPKDVVGVPWMVAFALREHGWWLRSEIIWSKNNGIPSPAKDRPAHMHETIFLLSNRRHYYCDIDAISEPQSVNERTRRLRESAKVVAGQGHLYTLKRDAGVPEQPKYGKTSALRSQDKRIALAQKGTRKRRSVWSMPTGRCEGEHYSVFPRKLPELCIRAGCPEGGVVLDPFCGSGTTGQVALRLERDFIGIDIDPRCIDMTRALLLRDAPILNLVEG